ATSAATATEGAASGEDGSLESGGIVIVLFADSFEVACDGVAGVALAHGAAEECFPGFGVTREHVGSDVCATVGGHCDLVVQPGGDVNAFVRRESEFR